MSDVPPQPSTLLESPVESIDEAKGLIRALFDFKFRTLVASKIIRFYYALAVALLSILMLFALIVSLTQGGSGVLIAIIVLPIVYLVYLIMLRIFSELMLVVFRIAEDLREIRKATPGTTKL